MLGAIALSYPPPPLPPPPSLLLLLMTHHDEKTRLKALPVKLRYTAALDLTLGGYESAIAQMLQLILLILHVITEVNNLFWCFWGNPDKHHFFFNLSSHKLDLVQGGSLWELASYFILKKNWKNIYQISAKNNNLHMVILLKIKSPNRVVIPCISGLKL